MAVYRHEQNEDTSEGQRVGDS